MNTLKLKLLAASLFACSAAFAQTPRTTPYDLGTAPGPNNGVGASTSRSTSARGVSFTNDSYVLQNGPSQYAKVDQSGGGAGNSADIIQNLANDPSDFGMDATQTQIHSGTAGRNKAFARQDGDRSVSIQYQQGGGNTGNVYQDDEDFNYATQSQIGDNNRAGITQNSGDNYAKQTQQGNNNYATTQQQNYASSSTIAQTGNMNTAIVSQR
ncbi:hypothetical protein A0257_11800 [Hymenobacter psoromatis]|nr:hypothetical protein A0257_11800 [Hymenobacter psoromatis]